MVVLGRSAPNDARVAEVVAHRSRSPLLPGRVVCAADEWQVHPRHAFNRTTLLVTGFAAALARRKTEQVHGHGIDRNGHRERAGIVAGDVDFESIKRVIGKLTAHFPLRAMMILERAARVFPFLIATVRDVGQTDDRGIEVQSPWRSDTDCQGDCCRAVVR